MRVHVKFFALFREMIGVKTAFAEIPEGTTVEQLWRKYAERSPRASGIRAAYAVNQRLGKPDQVLHEGDEVGFLPPVSGGAGQATKQKAKGKRRITARSRERVGSERKKTIIAQKVAVTSRKLDLGTLIRRVEYSGAGAIVTFTGVVRDNARGKPVDHLEYEAYPKMAESMMRDIIAEIYERWGDVRVAMAHRTGKLKIGEASLIIAIAAPHRMEAFAASRYAIERIKAVLPVWKKEFASDGDHWVEGPLAGQVLAEQAEKIARDSD